MKKRLIILAAVLLIGCLALCACEEGVSPVEKIVVTGLPVLDYYRGDFFNLNDAVLTVYYENGRVVNIPLEESMISDFDSQSVGKQILTVRYGDAMTTIEVDVKQAPIAGLAVPSTGAFRTEYVQGQSVDISELYLDVTYTNGFSERIPVTQEMISDFDTSTSGERRVAINYGGKTVYYKINVVARAISSIAVSEGDKAKKRYVVGQKIDFTDVKIRAWYNNNTDVYVSVPELLEDENFSYTIGGEETDTFTSPGEIMVTLNYFGKSVPYFITVKDRIAVSVKIKTNAPEQPRTSKILTPDWGDGSLEVEYNDGSKITVPMGDPDVTFVARDFDRQVLGKYEVDFIYDGVYYYDYVLEVVDPVEVKLIILDGDREYYQDGANIDVTVWHYRVEMSDGEYRSFNKLDGDGTTDTPSVTLDMVKNQPNYSCADFYGKVLIEFAYYNENTDKKLTASVTIDVKQKLMTGVEDFSAPTRSVYSKGDLLSLVGGGFRPVYNDGTRGEYREITVDMLEKGIELSSYTASLTDADGRIVNLDLTDTAYDGVVRKQFTLYVLKRVVSARYNAISSVGLKTAYILGECFDPTNLVINVVYDDDTEVPKTAIKEGHEWTFVGADMDETGSKDVLVYYGDISDGIFTRIPVTVTNRISEVKLSDGFSLGQVVEGNMPIIPADAKLTVIREDGSESYVDIASSSDVTVSYDRSPAAPAEEQVTVEYNGYEISADKRTVKFEYEGFEVFAPVIVVPCSIAEVKLVSLPTKLSYVVSDIAWVLDGLRLTLKYDNGTYKDITSAMSLDSTGADVVNYSFSVAGRNYVIAIDRLVNAFADGEYNRQSVNVIVKDVTRADYESNGTVAYEIICFRKLITNLTYFNKAGIQTAYEREELVLSDESGVKVTYSGETPTDKYFKDMAPSDYTVTGYDKFRSGIQTVTVSYLLTECTFTVNVLPKKLYEIKAYPDTVSVLEGNNIRPADLRLMLHFKRNDGTEYDLNGGYEGEEGYWQEVDFGSANIICTFDPYASFTFNYTDNNVGYCSNQYDVTYRLSPTESATVTITVRVYRKSVEEITMRAYPKQVYLEGDQDGLTFSGGEVLVRYNNGTTETIALGDDRLVKTVDFNLNEITDGKDRIQSVKVEFTDLNANTESTAYTVTVKDRRYCQVVFDSDPVDNIHILKYGSTVSQRPFFSIYGYLNFNDENPIKLADGDDIDTKSNFSVKFIDELGIERDIYEEVGLYTMVITYEGDANNNSLRYDLHRVRIEPKPLTVVVEDRELVFGDTFARDTRLYSHNFIGVLPADSALSIAEIEYRVYDSASGREIEFLLKDGKIIVNADCDSYDIVASLAEDGMINSNYVITRYDKGTLTVKQREIKIVGNTDYTKVYGEDDPRFNKYTVYDYATGEEIGHDGIVNFATYEDVISLYVLTRPRGEGAEDVDEYDVNAGAAGNIPNYSVKEYVKGKLTITRKPITVVGRQLTERKYGQDTLSGEDKEYSFEPEDESALAWDDVFGEVFAYLINYRTGVSLGKVTLTAAYNGSSYTTVPDADATVGKYTVSVQLSDIAGNYDVTIEDFEYEILPMNAEIIIKSRLAEYTEYQDSGLVEDGYVPYPAVIGTDYTVNYGDGYSLSTGPSVTLKKQVGNIAGRYRIIATDETYTTDNPNYVVTIRGDYGDFFDAVFENSGDEELKSLMGLELGEAEMGSAYMVILPVTISLEFDRTEVYAHKTDLAPQVTFGIEGFFAPSVLTELRKAVGFTFVNQDPSLAGYGYYTADTYDCTVTYDYFYSDTSVCFAIYGDVDSYVTVMRYCFGGEKRNSAIIYYETYDDYVVSQIPLDVRVINTSTGYTGEEIAIALNTEYETNLKASDTLDVIYGITVVYEGETEEVTTDKIINSGAYSVRILDLGNVNYILTEEAAAATVSFNVNTIELQTSLRNVTVFRTETRIDEEGQEYTVRIGEIHKSYTADSQRPMDNSWHEVDDHTKGYFGTTTQYIVNETSLSSNPSGLTLRPYYMKNGIMQDPTDHIDEGYKIVYVLNSEYKNYSVRFVADASNFGGSANSYVDCEYIFYIDKLNVTIRNFHKVNKQTYDGVSTPALDKPENTIFLSGDSVFKPADIDIKNDLIFTFTRDMTRIPADLAGYIDEDDMVSAGYFNVSVSMRPGKADNYNFSIQEGDDYFLIKRVLVNITLNTTVFSLGKQYDKLLPSASFEDIYTDRAVADEVHLDLLTKFKKNGSGDWVSFNAMTADAGVYAYSLNPYIIYNGHNYYTKDLPLDESSRCPLLSWNYAYSVAAYSGVEPTCDGIYNIKPKDIVLALDGGYTDVRVFGGEPNNYYIYNTDYSNTSITRNDACDYINDNYYVTDADGVALDGNLGFVRGSFQPVLTGSATALNAGDSFVFDFSAIADANPNFHITNEQVMYEISPLTVQITLGFYSYGNASYVYGGGIEEFEEYDGIHYYSVIDEKVIDFYDAEAFAAAIGETSYFHSNFGSSQAYMQSKLSENAVDYANNKFIIIGSKYYLRKTVEGLDTDYDIDDASLMPDAGTYAAYMDNINAQNYVFEIVGEEFEIVPRIFAVTDAVREYYSDTFKLNIEVDGFSVNPQQETRLANDLIGSFRDDSALTDNAGTGYHASADREQIVTLQTKYPNYEIRCDETTFTGASPSIVYIPLVINKVDVTMSISAKRGGMLTYAYGADLAADIDFAFSFDGRLLGDGTAGFDSEKLLAQSYIDAFDRQEDGVTVKGALRDYLKVIPAGDNIRKLDLRNYILPGKTVGEEDRDGDVFYYADLTNFRVFFGEVSYKVDKIVLNLTLYNNRADDNRTAFTVLYSELDSMIYDPTSTDRLAYSFSIDNPTAIIGYTAGMTMDDMMALIYGTATNMYSSSVAYEILKGGSADNISAGRCSIRLTDDWYLGQDGVTNYTLACRNYDIWVYPETQSLGDSNDNNLPFTAISLPGNPSEYKQAVTDRKRLSMLVRLNYSGMPEGSEYEWVDIASNAINPVFDGVGYSRTWEINFVGPAPASVAIGDILHLKLVYTERFYNGTPFELVNSIESQEFLVRVYPLKDTIVKDKTTAGVVAGSTGYDIEFVHSGNNTRFLTADHSTNNIFEGQFDIVETDFILSGINAASKLEILLYNDSSTGASVSLGMQKGAYYIKYKSSSSAPDTYATLNSYLVGGNSRPVSADVNVFDGNKHTLVAYFDKLGARGELVSEENDTINNRIISVYSRDYKVTFAIDDRYIYTITFSGGTITETYAYHEEGEDTIIDGMTISYDDDFDFSHDSRCGFLPIDCRVFFSRFTLKSKGVYLLATLFSGENIYTVNDVRVFPIRDGSIIYSTLSEFEELQRGFTFNSNDGYGSRVTTEVTYYNMYGDTVALGVVLNGGLFRVRLALACDGVTVLNGDGGEEIVNFYLCLITDDIVNANLVTAEEPTLIDASGSNKFVYSAALDTIDYTRVVFDFAEAGSDSSMSIMLKSNINTQSNFSTQYTTDKSSENAWLAINVMDGVRTKVYMRYGAEFWSIDLGNIDWVGYENVLEVRYDKNTGVINILLKRGGTTLLSKAIDPYSNSDIVFTGTPYSRVYADNILKLSSYVGVQAFHSTVTIYSYDTIEKTHTGYYWSDDLGRPIDLTNEIHTTVSLNGETGRPNGSVVYYNMMDAYGLPLATNTKSTYFKFSADASFRVMFANMTPEVTFNSYNTSRRFDRGVFLDIRKMSAGTFMSVSFYRCDTVYSRFNPVNIDLLNGRTHEVIVTISEKSAVDTRTVYNFGDGEIPAVRIIVSVKTSGSTSYTDYEWYVPRYNDLTKVQKYDAGYGVYSGPTGADFMPSSRYLGIMPMGTGHLSIKEMLVF